MKFVVVDASVAVKWLLPQQPEEADVDKALQLLQAVSRQDVRLLQPPHFLAELMGVVVRLAPDHAARLFTAVQHLEISVVDSAAVYQTAMRLSRELKHHLFDTLYHAAALETSDVVLITADAAYYRKAVDIGKIVLLQDYLAT
ncbi:MAG: type II toxin-antitoxin system VapC family toxin [Methylovulum sp.]|uniref:type II toxin-antitoxin system VapC family toxin n=1 Tax=Methylovulum sp. TaxID=1916980 RepID=UPI00262D8CDE|nr:type II toxin-antitoxin system VapC family toxin [Methylovulum sp.]MDD2724535.1 type II toxin-antitoxin system VapC family toxin [Methylovulum sp.]MDD5124034.1 type II toxin-antitoxin system VapC family toxin [Methylovulum sp.]